MTILGNSVSKKNIMATAFPPIIPLSSSYHDDQVIKTREASVGKFSLDSYNQISNNSLNSDIKLGGLVLPLLFAPEIAISLAVGAGLGALLSLGGKAIMATLKDHDPQSLFPINKPDSHKIFYAHFLSQQLKVPPLVFHVS